MWLRGDSGLLDGPIFKDGLQEEWISLVPKLKPNARENTGAYPDPRGAHSLRKIVKYEEREGVSNARSCVLRLACYDPGPKTMRRGLIPIRLKRASSWGL